MLLARRCPVCARLGPAPCAACIATLERPPRRPAPLGVDRLTAPFAYVGAGRELVARLKYRNARASVPWLAAAMAGVVDADGLQAITWVPTTTARRRRRGFDQGQLLARALARRLGVPCVRTLRRLPGPSQTGRTLGERRAGPRLTVGTNTIPTAVLLVDDVVTSGATLSTAALVLRAAGAKRVDAVTAASTPLKPSPGVVEAKVNGTNRRQLPERTPPGPSA